jgi:hypothetical protein
MLFVVIMGTMWSVAIATDTGTRNLPPTLLNSLPHHRDEQRSSRRTELQAFCAVVKSMALDKAAVAGHSARYSYESTGIVRNHSLR